MNKLTILILSLLTASPIVASAQTTKPGYIPEYHYQVTELSSMEEGQRLMDLETRDTNRLSICANRAHLWAYDLKRNMGVQTGKVFIHFTPKGQANENGRWAYHVAPYIIIQGEEYVLDAGFGVFKGKPTPISKWMNYFGKSEQCVVLDPIHNPEHLKLEQNNMPNDQTLPIHFTGGGARQYPTPAQSKCYVRKVPMYYQFPMDTYGADLYLSGREDHSGFYLNEMTRGDVLQACKQATNLKFKLNHKCTDYLGF